MGLDKLFHKHECEFSECTCEHRTLERKQELFDKLTEGMTPVERMELLVSRIDPNNIDDLRIINMYSIRTKDLPEIRYLVERWQAWKNI